MLGLTLWAVNFFQDGRDVLGGIFFVLALSFKQMALYYAPAVCVTYPACCSMKATESLANTDHLAYSFAFLLGKCFWLGGADGCVRKSGPFPEFSDPDSLLVREQASPSSPISGSQSSRRSSPSWLPSYLHHAYSSRSPIGFSRSRAASSKTKSPTSGACSTSSSSSAPSLLRLAWRGLPPCSQSRQSYPLCLS